MADQDNVSSLLNSFSSYQLKQAGQSLGVDAPEAPPSTGVLGHIALQAGNLPSNIINTVGDTAANIGTSLAGSTQFTHSPTTFNVPTPTTFGQKATDFIGGQFIPQTAAFLATHAAAVGVLEDLGLSAKAAQVAGMATAGGLTSGGEGTDTIQGAALGAGFAALHGLSPLQKLGAVGGVTAANTAFNTTVNHQSLGDALLNSAQIPVMAYTPEILNKLAGNGWIDPSSPEYQQRIANHNIAQEGQLQQAVRNVARLQPSDDLNAFNTERRFTTAPNPLLNSLGFDPTPAEIINNSPKYKSAPLQLEAGNLLPPVGDMDALKADLAFREANPQQSLAIEAARGTPSPILPSEPPTVKDLGLPSPDFNKSAETSAKYITKLRGLGWDLEGDPDRTNFIAQATDLVGANNLHAQANDIQRRWGGDDLTALTAASKFNVLQYSADPELRLKATRIYSAPTDGVQLNAQAHIKLPIEAIKSAAIQTMDGKIVEGFSHGDAFDKAGTDEALRDGFTTTSGRFVDRIEALNIAKQAGQFKPDLPEFPYGDELDSGDISKKKVATLQLPDKVVYQGKDDLGLHNFKDEVTGGNFTVKENQLSTAKVQEKTQAVRQSFATAQEESHKSELKNLLTGNMNGGYVSGHLLSTLAGASIGGITANAKSHGDTQATIEGVFLGAFLGLGAHLGAEGFKAGADALSTKESLVKAATQDTRDSLWSRLSSGTKELAGQNATGRGSVISKVAWAAEKLAWLNLPEDVKTTASQAYGRIAEIFSNINHSIKNIKDYANVSDDVKDRVSRYLKGQLANSADVKSLIASEGGMDRETYLKQDKIIRASKPATWKLQDSEGNVTDIYHISSDTKAKLVAMENKALIQGLDGKDLQFAQFGQEARGAINHLQDSIAAAMPEGSNLKDIINGSLEQYLTRGYKIFTDKNFWPEESNIAKYMKEYGEDTRSQILNKEVLENRAFTPDELRAQQDKATDPHRVAMLQQKVPVEHKGQTFMVDPDVAKTYKAFSNDDILRGHVEQLLHDYKTNRKVYAKSLASEGSDGIDTTILKKRLDLSPTFRELIGQFSDPVEEISHTMNRLNAPAKAAEFISRIADVKIHDLPAMMDVTKYDELNRGFKSAIEVNRAQGNLQEVARLQQHLDELNTHVKMPADVKFGLLKDQYVSRYIADQFKDYRGPWGDMTNPIARGMAKANLISKLVHSPYNPVTQMRNILQAPMFMAIARVNPIHLMPAWDAIRNVENTLHGEMMREGVLPATHAMGELGFNLNKIVNGAHDSELLKVLKETHNFVLDKYNIPDSWTRAAAYLSEKNRQSKKLNLPLNDPTVIKNAVAFTNRYTPNYETIAPVVKLARNIPAFNLYVSYTAEMARLTKNLVQDSLHGDVQSMAILGGLATIPYALVKGGVAALSPSDQKEWAQLENQLPDYARNRFRIPTYKDNKGNFHFIDFTALIPTDAFHQTFDAVRKGDWASVAAVNPLIGWQNTPAFNIIAEQVAGKDLFSGRDFRTSSELQNLTDRFQTFAKEVTPSWTPGVGYEWQKWASIGETNSKTGRTIIFDDQIIHTLTGVMSSSYNAGIVNRQALSDAKSKMDLEKQYLQDVLKTQGISDEKRQRAISTYQDAIQTILFHYRSRILNQDK